jgi:hypothetical protein
MISLSSDKLHYLKLINFMIIINKIEKKKYKQNKFEINYV